MPDVQQLGKQVRDGIMTCFHDAGHELLTCTDTSRPPVLEYADKRKKKPVVDNPWKPGTDDIDAEGHAGKRLMKLAEQSAVPSNTPRPECTRVTFFC